MKANAVDVGGAFHCDARDLGLEYAGGRFGRRLLFVVDGAFFLAVMERSAVHVSRFFPLPNDHVVEIGQRFAI